MIMEQSRGRIIFENNLSKKFSVFKGVKEGDTLSTVFLTFRRRASSIQGCIQKFQDSTCKKKFAYLGC